MRRLGDGNRQFVAGAYDVGLITASKTTPTAVTAATPPPPTSCKPPPGQGGNAGTGIGSGNSGTNGGPGTAYAASSDITVGTRPVFLTATSDGAQVYVPNQGSNNVSVITKASNAVTTNIPVGTSILGGSRPQYGHHNANNVYVLNTGRTTCR